MIHFSVHLKLAQHCKSTTSQFKTRKKRNKTISTPLILEIRKKKKVHFP